RKDPGWRRGRHRPCLIWLSRWRPSGPSSAALRSVPLMDFELDQIAEATGLLLQAVRFKQELLFEGGELQVGRKSVDKNFIVHVKAKKPLPQMAILSLRQILIQNADKIQTDRCLK